MSKKILITGGAGFIGSHLCEELLENNYNVICLDNFNDYYDPRIKKDNIANSLKNKNFTLVKGDILDKECLENIFYENNIHKIVHLAAIAGVRPSLMNPQEYVEVDIKGTVNLLEMAKKYNIQQFIFGSSSSVYGINSKIPFSEEDRIDLQVSPYATAKRCAELYCATYHYLYKVPITILRFFTVYGSRQRPDMAIHKFTKLIYRGKPIPVFGNGESKRDYTYVDDVVNGIISSLEKNNNFEIFNIGNSKMIKLTEVIKIIADKLKITPKVKQLPEQPGDVSITCANILKAKKVLGYNPIVSIEDGIEYFIEWYLLKKDLLQGKIL